MHQNKIDRMVTIFYGVCNFCFICYAIGLLQYSKSVCSKVGTPIVYIIISCILMTQNCIRCGKGCQTYNVFNFRGIFFTNKITLHVCWESLAYTIKNSMLCYLFLHFFLHKMKDLNSIKNILCCIMKNWKLCNPLLVVYAVYEKTASYINIK